MKVFCAPRNFAFARPASGDIDVRLYDHADKPDTGAIGASILDRIRRRKLDPAARAWDLLSIALSVVAADTAARRDKSPDGWTRQIDLHIAVSDPGFWNTQRNLLTCQLRFLTGDIWDIAFLDGGVRPIPPKRPLRPAQDCVVLLSGGLDSLVGAIDLVKAHGRNPYAVSQVSIGDKRKQQIFASSIGDGLAHLQLNHNFRQTQRNETSQRARSIVFLAYGVLAATSLKRYRDRKPVALYVCENGFISINPPLTGARLGSLSTRTTHPHFFNLFQKMLDAAGLRVVIENPYRFKTKGEMLQDCADQAFLRNRAHASTSCGRHTRHGGTHCGRRLPCLIRRAAFQAWGVNDSTSYRFQDLSLDDERHSRYDDVRCAAMAVLASRADGLVEWAGPALSSRLLDNVAPYRDTVERGLDELAAFLAEAGAM